jgi:hypothetical protein
MQDRSGSVGQCQYFSKHLVLVDLVDVARQRRSCDGGQKRVVQHSCQILGDRSLRVS